MKLVGMGFRLHQKYMLALAGSVLVFVSFVYVLLRAESARPSISLRPLIRDVVIRKRSDDEYHRIQQSLLRNLSVYDVAYRRNFVRGMMKYAWDNYRRYAWGENELRPISKTGHSSSVFGRARLGASIVDAIDTLYIMELTEEFEQAKEWVRTEFDMRISNGELSVFETNIRFVGGLLSTYALTNDTLFLDRAREVADMLLPAFDTPTGLPLALVNMRSGRAYNWGWASGGCSILSEVGSLELEFNYLSHVTHNDTYRQKVRRVREVMDQVEKADGLYSNYINQKTGRFCLKHVSIGALGDSFYEYLLKVYLQTGDESAKKQYDAAMDALEKKLLFQSEPSGLWYYADLRGNRVEHKMDHLACFSAGMYALQAKYERVAERRARALQMGRELGKTCRESYARTATGIGPEAFRFTSDVEAQAIRDGERYYILRPEVVEGWFFLWRATHDHIYREWAWEAVRAIDRHCRVDGGFSGIRNVDKLPVVHDDVQQSFILAETLKYLYLTFADDDLLDLDHWVFNTEAHATPIMNKVAAVESAQTQTSLVGH